MSHANTTSPSVTDEVFEQFRLIDKHLSNAQAALALGLIDQAVEHFHLARPLSDSLMFRLVSERMQPENKALSPIYTSAPKSAMPTAKGSETEQAALA